MKKDYETMTVGEIVADNFGNAEVFDKYGIDFCCHGSILLPEASQKAGADMDEIIKDIENLAPITTENIDFKNWPLDLLADYILKIHHRNIRKNGPKIQELLDKVCKVHGENHPALYNVQVLLRQSLSDLNQHLDKEGNYQQKKKRHSAWGLSEKIWYICFRRAIFCIIIRMFSE